MKLAQYPLDETFGTDACLRALAEQYGTPLLVYDRKTLENRVRMLQKAFAWAPDFRQFFPVKAVANPAVLELYLRAGCGLLCGSASELMLAVKAGARGEDLVFSAPFPGNEDWETVRRTGASVILDSPEQLMQAPSVRGAVLGLRLQCVRGGGQGVFRSCFGMNRRQLLETAKQAVRMGAIGCGIHVHESGLYRPGQWADTAGSAFATAAEIQGQSGLDVFWCDLGGGLLWDRKGTYTPDLQKEAEAIKGELQRCSLGRIAIHTQLGRFLAAPCAVLLTTVRGVKGALAGVDTSLADLPRAALAGVQYHVSVLGKSDVSGRSNGFLFGWTSDGLDRFGGRRLLPPLHPGDILVFHGAGAYSRSMASNFGGSLRCPEVLLEGNGTSRLIRRRETWDDLFSSLLG